MKFRIAILFILTAGLLSACNFSLASDITPPPNYKSPTPAPTLGALFPSVPPSPQNGSAIYKEKCAPCHGGEGRGDGPQGLQLSVKVPGFGLPSAGRAAIPSNFFTMVSQGKIENFMPPFSGSLNEQQRWDVVAYVLSLHTTAEELAQGKALYEANCANCHGEDGSTIAKVNLADQQFMARRTEQDLFNAMTNGAEGMPAFDQLSEDDRWALAAYVRSLTFAEAEPTATPQPLPTEAATPTASQATPEGTIAPALTVETTSQPVLDATPVPTIAPNTTGNVTGSAASASGISLPAGLKVTLFGFDHGQDSTAPQQVLELTADVQPDGTYLFENVEIPEGRFFISQVKYQGVPYESDVSVVDAGATELDMTPISLYETTGDLENLDVQLGHVIVDFDAANIRIREYLVINNVSDKTVIFASDGNTLPFAPMPDGVDSLGFDLQQGEAFFLQTDDGSIAAPPSDKIYVAAIGFTKPYQKSADITIPIGIAMRAIQLIAPDGVKIKSDQLASQPPRDQSTDQLFAGGPLNKGDQLNFTVSGKLRAGSAPATSADNNTGLLVGIGALGLALIGGGIYLYVRERRKTDENEEEIPEPAEGSADEIMDAIIALDDQYRAGNLSEEAYQKRRAGLKAQLKDKV